MRRPISAHLLPAWIDARCELGRSLFDRAGELYDSWREYAHGREAEPGSPAEFALAMEARGYHCDRLKGDRCRIRWGLRLRQLPRVKRARGAGKSSAGGAPSTPSPASFGDFFRRKEGFGQGNDCGGTLCCSESRVEPATSRKGKIHTVDQHGTAAGVSVALRRAWQVDRPVSGSPDNFFPTKE